MYEFYTKNDFIKWLSTHHNHPGIWIKFDKEKTDIILTAEEALDAALCYGWIDGKIKRIDDKYYMKYFAMRHPKSIWSTKNKHSVARLIKAKEMTTYGLKAIEIAKNNGMWDKADLPSKAFSMAQFTHMLQEDQEAYNNYLSMSPSIQKTYAYYYYDAKREITRLKRKQEIMMRLRKKLKPLDPMK